MANKVTCSNCGTECCTCWGCNPNTYINGLCPACQEKLKQQQDAPSQTN
jgi:hypothetical protein